MNESTFQSHSNFTRGSISNPSEGCWVVKLGGSLLDLPNLAERLRTAIRQVSRKPLVIVGGGPTAELVRGWDDVHSLPASSAHWLAVRAMEFNQHLVKTLLPETIPISHPDQAHGVWERNEISLLNSWEWLTLEDEIPPSLPQSWDVTSDSIAAWVTIRWRAEGLVLLKSLDAPQSDKSLCESVDGYFPRLAHQLPTLAWCNLRSDPIQVLTLQSQHDTPSQQKTASRRLQSKGRDA